MNPYQGLNAAPDVGSIMMQGFERGQAKRKERDSQNALMQYALNPDDPASFEGLARTNPQVALQERRRQQEAALKGLEAHRDNITKGAQIVRQFGVKDQASWDAAKQAASQLGIDLSDVPAEYNPQYIQGLVSIADAFEPQKGERPQIVTTQAGGGMFRIDEQGNAVPLIVPNPGGQQMGAPANGQMPQVNDEASYNAIPPGTQYVGPDGQVRVKQGGPTPQASGGFPSSGY